MLAVKFSTLVLLLAITSASIAAEIVDIEFANSQGVKFRTTTLASDLRTGMGYDLSDVQLLLIETPALDADSFREQNYELHRFGSRVEEFKVMYVVACTEDEFSFGHHTTTQVATELAGNSARFRIRLLDARGLVKAESIDPVTENELVDWLSNSN